MRVMLNINSLISTSSSALSRLHISRNGWVSRAGMLQNLHIEEKFSLSMLPEGEQLPGSTSQFTSILTTIDSSLPKCTFSCNIVGRQSILCELFDENCTIVNAQSFETISSRFTHRLHSFLISFIQSLFIVERDSFLDSILCSFSRIFDFKFILKTTSIVLL